MGHDDQDHSDRPGPNDWHDVEEKFRMYRYADKQQLRYQDVKRIRVSLSGNHYIEYGDGLKAIVAPGWRCIELVGVKEWTF